MQSKVSTTLGRGRQEQCAVDQTMGSWELTPRPTQGAYVRGPAVDRRQPTPLNSSCVQMSEGYPKSACQHHAGGPTLSVSMKEIRRGQTEVRKVHRREEIRQGAPPKQHCWLQRVPGATGGLSSRKVIVSIGPPKALGLSLPGI